MKTLDKSQGIEVLLWSIALPGFGQILNRKFLKGLLLISLEFLVNVQSHLNDVIISSFNGGIGKAISQTNYQWIMFYPYLYMFGIWDAYRDAGGGQTPYAAMPFVFGAYFGTIGVIYSADLKILGVFIGAVWLGLLGLLVGIIVGNIIKKYLFKRTISGQP